MTAGDCSREKKRIHRYNRRQSVRKVLFLAAVLMAAAAFCCTAIRAFTTNLTDDEAYTYINYVRAYQPLNLSWLIHLYSTCKANNHWLNTFLIWCTSQVLGPYSEAAIRLPNVVLFAGYLAAVLAALRRGRISFLCSVFLISNYYLNEFFGLGRGYGMAAAFVLFTLLAYGSWRRTGCKDGRYVLLILLCLTLGAASNTVVLLLYPSVGLLMLYHMIRGKRLGSFLRVHFIAAVLFVLCTCLLVRYHLEVSVRDTALYVGTQDYVHSTVMEFLHMLVTGRTASLALAVLILAATAAAGVILVQGAVRRQSPNAVQGHHLNAAQVRHLNAVPARRLNAVQVRHFRTDMDDAGAKVPNREETHAGVISKGAIDYFWMLALFALVSMAIGAVFHRGYLTGRTTLPFWPLVVLGGYGLAQAAAAELAARRTSARRVLQIVSVLCAALVFILFLKKVRLNSTRDWPWDYGTRERVAESVQKTGDYPEDAIQDYTDIFYMAKYGLDITPYLGP